MSRKSYSTLQANRAMQGNYAGTTTIVPGTGVGIYTGVGGIVEILTHGGDTILYTAVPQGTFMQVPLFKAITSNTDSTDLTVAYQQAPLP